ncbi:MAG: alpha/beta fold hydrolase [Nitrosomonadales bacterium]|nr:alpha/beta fold hydrolase [Nitrosomonadales bacterium]
MLMFEPEAELLTTPARNGMRYEDVRIPSGSGAERGELAGWLIPAQAADAPTLLYLHGNFRNISVRPEIALRLHELGYNLLMVDYRGYGKSSGGYPSEAKIYEDAEAAWRYLVSQRGVQPRRAIIYGHSLGGAIAIDLAVRHPEAAGLIVESSFTSMQAMGERDYGFLPIASLLNQRFDSIVKISQVKTPLLILHGTADQKIAWQMGQQLYDQAAEPKTLKLINGGEHSNLLDVSWPEYREAVDGFIRSNVK